MPSGNCDFSLILPAYNEAGAIAITIQEASEYCGAQSWNYEIIVAADGNDGTRELVGEIARNNTSVRVIGEPARRGKGKGIREGVMMATGAIIGFADADNKVPIAEFDKLKPFLDQDYSVVIGSRGVVGSRITRPQPWYRRVGSRGFGLFMHFVVGLPEIHDTQCGFKFFPGEVAHDLFSRQRIDGYMFDVEILALAQRLGYRIREVPVLWRDDGDSRLQLVSGNLRNMRDVFKIRTSARQQCESPAKVRAHAKSASS